MTKTLKQILGEKPILFTADVPERVKEWLMQKRQEAPQFMQMRYEDINKLPLKCFAPKGKIVFIDELLEELE